jgi:hypothetical protein
MCRSDDHDAEAVRGVCRAFFLRWLLPSTDGAACRWLLTIARQCESEMPVQKACFLSPSNQMVGEAVSRK